MNPRDFCSENGYEITIALTYSFDPGFFERVILNDLWSGNSSQILIIADAEATQEAMQRASDSLMHLGRKYHLRTASPELRQHAKIMIRLGEQGALLWAGSGNLTCGGWGGNREVAAAWKVKPDNKADAILIRQLLTGFQDLLPGEKDPTLLQALDISWVAAARGAADRPHSLLFSEKNSPLAPQLAKRWAGRRFRRAKILTGSTDDKGAFLRWASENLGIEEAVVAFDPNNSDFQPELLSKLPLKVEILPLPPNPLPHAKFYWFEGDEGAAALAGSANCSAAAWLAPYRQGGNMETMAVYDQASESDFAHILGILREGAPKAPSEIPELRNNSSKPEEPKNKEEAVGPSLTSLVLCSGGTKIRAVVHLRIEKTAEVTLILDDARIRLACDDNEGRSWSGPAPEQGRSGPTQFGILEIISGGTTILTERRWVDDEGMLLHIAPQRRYHTGLDKLPEEASPSEYKKISEEIAWACRNLFSDKGAFPDPRPGTEIKKKKTEPQSSQPPVKLSEILTNVRSIQAAPGAGAGGYDFGLTISGVMRALFLEDEPDEDSYLEEGNGEEKKNRKKETAKKGTEIQRPPESARKRVVKEVDTLIDKLAGKDFASTCTATKMAQAAAYPLMVSLLGIEGSWLDAAQARKWILRTTEILIHGTSGKSAGPPLLETVQARYKKDGRSDIFETVVGDGTLWVALASAFAGNIWDDPSDSFARALNLSEILRLPILYRTTDPGKLRDLLSRLHGGDSRRTVLAEALEKSALLDSLAEALDKDFESLVSMQGGIWHRKGDPLWVRGIGFARALEDCLISGAANLAIRLEKDKRQASFRAHACLNLKFVRDKKTASSELLRKILPS